MKNRTQKPSIWSRCPGQGLRLLLPGPGAISPRCRRGNFDQCRGDGQLQFVGKMPQGAANRPVKLQSALGVTDQNVVAGYLERLAAAVRYLCDIGQISKIVFSQTDYSRRRFGVVIVASANISQRGFLCPPMLLFFSQWIAP